MRYSIISIICVQLTVSLTGCWVAAAGAGAEAGYVIAQEVRSTSETISDQFATAAIKSKLLADPQVSGFGINVDTFRSVVTLTGTLDSELEASKAIKIANSVRGVSQVNSKLIILK